MAFATALIILCLFGNYTWSKNFAVGYFFLLMFYLHFGNLTQSEYAISSFLLQCNHVSKHDKLSLNDKVWTCKLWHCSGISKQMTRHFVTFSVISWSSHQDYSCVRSDLTVLWLLEEVAECGFMQVAAVCDCWRLDCTLIAMTSADHDERWVQSEPFSFHSLPSIIDIQHWYWRSV